MPIPVLMEGFLVSELKQLQEVGRGRVLGCRHKGENEEPQAKQRDTYYHMLKGEKEKKGRLRY